MKIPESIKVQTITKKTIAIIFIINPTILVQILVWVNLTILICESTHLSRALQLETEPMRRILPYQESAYYTSK